VSDSHEVTVRLFESFRGFAMKLAFPEDAERDNKFILTSRSAVLTLLEQLLPMKEH
jgi:hypothetical protein